uniref:Prominin-1 n=1 Tax=Magallana gigas TaxID=29159 RepID=K1PJ91_MAGGI
MRRQIVLAIISFSCLVFVNGQNTTSNTQTSPTGTRLGEESALEKGAKPLYDLVHGFLDSVQEYDFIADDSAKITYQQIEGYIKNGTFEKFSERWQDMVSVFGGFAACIIVGLLFAIFMPIIGLFFCCCYCCCKRCGKAREKSDPKSAGCKRATYCFFLAVFATMMLTGGIVSIISNELLHNKLQNSDQRGPIQYLRYGLAESLEEDTKGIVRETINDIKQQINGSVKSTVDGVKSSINASVVLTQTENLGKRAKKVYDDLVNITGNLEELKTLQSNLSDKINEINTNFTSACGSPPPNCPQLPALSNDFTVVNNLTDEINKVKNALDISSLTEQANKQFDVVADKIFLQLQNKTNEALNKSDDIENEINSKIHKLTDSVKQLTESIKGNTSKEIDNIEDFLKKNADYVWYGGLGLPCVIFLSVVFYYLGILFGLCGQRPGHDAPCCNRGAGSNFIVGGVVWTFLIFWLLMYIVMILFIVGGLLYTNGCRNLNKGVENIGKYEALLQNYGLDIKNTLNYSSSSNFSIEQALIDCKNNKGLYMALELQNRFNLDTLLDTTDVIKEIEDLTSSSNIHISDINILSSNLNQSLSDFANSGITLINFTSYEEQLNKDPITNLSGIIHELEAVNLNEQAEMIRSLNNTELKDFGQKMELNTSIANVTDIVKRGLEKAKNDTKHAGGCKPLYNAAQALTDSVCVVVLNPFNTFWFGLGWGIFFSIPSIVFALLLANMYQREDPFDKELHEAKKKSRQKQEHQDFDSPPPNGGYARSNNGEVNPGYYNDRRDDYHRGNQYRDDYRRDDYQGSRGDPYYRQGERDYPPPSYHDSRHYPSPGHRDGYPVLPPTKNRY